MLAVDEQGLDLRLLIGGEAERLSEVLELAVGVHMAHAAALLTLVGCGGIVLSEGGSGGSESECAAECEGEEFVAHDLIVLRS